MTISLPSLDIADAAATLERFAQRDLTGKISQIEAALRGVSGDGCASQIRAAGADASVFAAAACLKEITGQIHVTMHALGILLCLSHVLEKDEVIEYVSLGSGNTGRAFDLETDRRVAEFKFINWRGGPESTRQNGVFKDFFMMAENPTPKRKYLYVLGVEFPTKFLNGRRALTSVLSRGEKVKKLFFGKYGDRFATVRDYYATKKDTVVIEDVSAVLGPMVSLIAED